MSPPAWPHPVTALEASSARRSWWACGFVSTSAFGQKPPKGSEATVTLTEMGRAKPRLPVQTGAEGGETPRGGTARGAAQGPPRAPAPPGGQRERVRPRIRFLLLRPPVPSAASANAPLRASGGFRGLGQPPPACLSPDGAAAPTPGPLHTPSSPRSLPVLPGSPERRRPRAAGPSGASGDTDCLLGAGTRALRCAGDPTWGQSW